MSDTASGNEGEGREDDLSDADVSSGPEGEELPADPDSEEGDHLDPVDRWWDDSGGSKRDIRRNRKREDVADQESGDSGSDWLGDADGESSTVPGPTSRGEAEEAIEEEEPLGGEPSGGDDGSVASDPGDSGQEVAASADENLPWKSEEQGPSPGAAADDAPAEVKEAPGEPDEEALPSTLEGSVVSPGDGGVEPEREKDEPDDEGETEVAGDDAFSAIREESTRSSDPPAPRSPAAKTGERAGGSSTTGESAGKEDDSRGAEEEPAGEGDEQDATEKSEKGDGESAGSRSGAKGAVAAAVVGSAKKETKDETHREAETSAASTASTSAAAPAKRKAGCWTVFTTLFFIAALIVLAAVVAAGLFAWSRLDTLEEDLFARARQELADRGIHVDYAEWRYEFPRGLAFEDVSLYESEQRESAWLQATDMGVDLDFVTLIRDREATGAEVSFRDSEIRLSDANDRAFTLEGVNGEMLVDGSGLEVERLAAGIGGVRVHASGRVAWPAQSGADDSAGDGGNEGNAGDDKKALAALPPDLEPLAKAAPWLDVSANEAPPTIELEFDVPAEKGESMSLSARARGRDFTWIGVPVASLAASCQFDPAANVLRFDTLQVGYGDGLIGGEFVADLENEQLRVDKFQSNVDLIELLSDSDEEMGERLASVTFVDDPTVRLTGTVPFESPAGADLEIEYDHREGLEWRMGERELAVSDLRGGLTYSGGSLETRNFAARVLGGDVAINGVVRLTEQSTPFNGVIEISGMSLGEAAAWFDKEDLGMTGDMHLTFRGAGYRDVSKIRGGGTLRIDEAKLPSFPVIGPVQERLGRVVPAFGVQGEGAVTGNYLVESGILVTNDLTVRQGGTNLVVNGNLKLDTLETEFTATGGLEPTLAGATGLEDRQIVVAGSGPVTKPNLRLERFPVAFASTEHGDVLGTSSETLGRLEDMLDDPERAAEVIGTGLEEAGVELSPEVDGLIRGLLGGGADAEGEKPPPRALPVEEDE